MEKNEIIKEMERDILNAYAVNKLYSQDVAKFLYEQGYRKIPEGSVVYTKEDQEDMKISIRHEIYCECNKARKETAEKIYKEYLCDILSLEAKEEFAKQFSVEVEE